MNTHRGVLVFVWLIAMVVVLSLPWASVEATLYQQDNLKRIVLA